VLRAVLFDDALVSALLTMVGVAFVIFTNYMITDPGTTPWSTRGQVAFGMTTAMVYGALVVAHVTFGLFFALTLVCAGNLVFMWGRERWRSLRTVPAQVPAARVPAPAPVAATARVP
jgi:hypothetical protein